MARGSSAKKIARVAAAGGDRRARRQRNLGYSAALVGIVVVGLLLVAFARSQNQAASANDDPPKANLGDGNAGDHWHAAVSVQICGQELPAAQDSTEPDTLGIHTHGDGVAHIHPFASSAGGSGAKLGKYFDRIGIDASSSQIRMPDGKIYRAGETTCAGKPGEIVVAYWKSALEASGKPPDKVITTDPGDIRFTEDNAAFTLAFREKGADVAAPSNASNLIQLGQADAGGASAPPGEQPVPDLPDGGTPDTGAPESPPPPSDPAATAPPPSPAPSDPAAPAAP